MAGGAAGLQGIQAGAQPLSMAAPIGGGTLSVPGNGGMAPWQQGLMAAITGNQQYGQNAPMLNQALKGLTQQRPQQQGGAAPMMRRPMPQGPVPAPSPGPVPQMQMPFAQGQQGQQPQMQQQSMAPWMRPQGM